MEHPRIKALLKQSEGPKLDFKEKIDITTESGKKELAKDVLAIANTQGGRGHILVGIRDKSKEVIGINPEDYAEERIQQTLSLRCDPPVFVRVEHLIHLGKELVLITVFKSHNKPHQMLQTGAFYLRRGSTTDLARRDEIAGMFQYNGMLHNEQVPLHHLEDSVLDEKLVQRYLKLRRLDREPRKEILLSEMGVLHYDGDTDSFVPTMGGLLLFAREPELYFPSFELDLSIEVNQQWEHLAIGGNILSQINAAEEYLLKTGLAGKLPFEAFMEGICNAVLHRDYFDLSRKVHISIGQKQIVISNPGSVYGNERLSDIQAEANPSRRNHWLYHQLLLLDGRRRFMGSGTGLNRIKAAIEPYGRVKIANLRRNNIFKLILPGLSAYDKDMKF